MHELAAHAFHFGSWLGGGGHTPGFILLIGLGLLVCGLLKKK